MSEFIPLSQLPAIEEYRFRDRNSVEPAFSWNFELPGHVDIDRLVLDAGHLRRIQKVGAFTSNHVFSHQGEQTEYDYSIKGINENGTALAGRESVAKKAEASQVGLNSDHGRKDSVLANYFTVDAVHSLNKTELAQRVSQLHSSRGPFSHKDDESRWASVLDNELQRSIREAGKKHLLHRSNKMVKGVGLGIVGMYGSFAALDIAAGQPEWAAGIAGWFSAYIAMNITMDSVRNRMNDHKTHIEHRRWSLFESMQPDRYVALAGLTQVNSLIRARK